MQDVSLKNIQVLRQRMVEAEIRLGEQYSAGLGLDSQPHFAESLEQSRAHHGRSKEWQRIGGRRGVAGRTDST